MMLEFTEARTLDDKNDNWSSKTREYEVWFSIDLKRTALHVMACKLYDEAYNMFIKYCDSFKPTSESISSDKINIKVTYPDWMEDKLKLMERDLKELIVKYKLIVKGAEYHVYQRDISWRFSNTSFEARDVQEVKP